MRTFSPSAPAGFDSHDVARRIRPVLRRCIGLLLVPLLLSACADNESLLLYRLPYADGTQVCVGRDHDTHTPQVNRYDLGGDGGEEPYRVVAAQTGIVRLIQDANTQNCCNGGGCGNNYVWIQHIGVEWTKYSHLATGSVRGEAGLSEGDLVVAGQFIGYESDIGRACSRCGSRDHLHFEVGVPADPNNPVPNHGLPNAGGFIAGENRQARFCNVQDQALEQGRDEVAASCGLIQTCLRSPESPTTEAQCHDGASGRVCVRELGTAGFPFYQHGTDFATDTLRIDLEWCADGNCEEAGSVGRSVELNVTHDDGEVTSLLLSCENRRVRQAFQQVESIEIRSHDTTAGNVACDGTAIVPAFARWEICDVPPQLLGGG